MNNAYAKVLEFHKTFNGDYKTSPTLLPVDRTLVRSSWMGEELVEFMKAQTIEAQADAMIDLIYFALGTLVEMGVKPEQLFDIVHAANMAKLWDDGKPRFNEQGKIVKPPHWIDPASSLKAAIEYQIHLGSEDYEDVAESNVISLISNLALRVKRLEDGNKKEVHDGCSNHAS